MSYNVSRRMIPGIETGGEKRKKKKMKINSGEGCRDETITLR